MRFSSKITLLFTAITLTAAIVSSYFIHYFSANLIKKRVEKELSSVAAHTLDKLDRVIYNKFIDLKFLASDPVIMDKGSSPAQITARLQNFLDIHKTYLSATFYDMDRVRVADTTGKLVGQKHELEEYWKGLETNDFNADISDSESLGRIVLHFAQKVVDKKGEPIGVVVARLPFSILSEIIEGPEIGLAGVAGKYKVDLVDSNGIVIYSNHDAQSILKEKLPDWELVKNKSASGNFGILTEKGADGKTGIFVLASQTGFMDYKGQGWKLVYEFPEDSAFSQAGKLRNLLLVILQIMGVSSLAIIYFFSRKITAPLEKLVGAAAAVGKGDLEVRVDSANASSDEIGHLTKAFAAMVWNLKESRDKLVSYSKELERSEKSLNEAQKIASIGSWEWYIEKNIVSCSDVFCEILGEKPKEPFSYEAFLKFVHSDEVDYVKDSVRDAVLYKKPYSIEYRIIRPNGAVRFVYAKGEVKFDEKGHPCRMLGTLQDITDRKLMEIALGKSEERYRLLAENAQDLIYRYELGPFKGFSFVSKSCLAITGYSVEDHYSDPEFALKITHPEDRKIIEACFRAEGAHSGLKIFRIIRKDGAIVWLEQRNYPVHDKNGNIIAVEGIARDITERKASEERLVSMNSELQHALGKVKLLSGLLPMCSSCKRIRDDEGYWNSLEHYIKKNSEAEFTHSICPECISNLYPEYGRKKNRDS